MQYLFICAFLYVVLVFIDLKKCMQDKHTKAFVFSIAIYAVTFALQGIVAFAGNWGLTTEIIERAIDFVFKV